MSLIPRRAMVHGTVEDSRQLCTGASEGQSLLPRTGGFLPCLEV